MSAPLPRGPLISTFLRSFALQGSWNYRTMVGCGFGFALLPVLRHLAREDRLELNDAVRRHIRHFNTHPYLSGIALGAVTRLESEGEDPEVIERFKSAIRGPLGGLGDSLIWAVWLPSTLVGGLIAVWLGAPPIAAVLLFLVVYNVGHLGLRVWGFRVGLAEGKRVGPRLRSAALGHLGERLSSIGVILLGVLTSLIFVDDPGLHDPGALWVPLGAVAFGVGLVLGQRAWRPAALTVVIVIGIITTTQFL